MASESKLQTDLNETLFELYKIYVCENKPYRDNHYTSHLITFVSWLHKLNSGMSEAEFYQYFLSHERRIHKGFYYGYYPGETGDSFYKLIDPFFERTLQTAKPPAPSASHIVHRATFATPAREDLERVLFGLYEIYRDEKEPYFENIYTQKLITIIDWRYKLDAGMTEAEFYQHVLKQENSIKQNFFNALLQGENGEKYWSLMSRYVHKTLCEAKAKLAH